MLRLLVVVPKFDELRSVVWAFGLESTEPEEVTSYGTQVLRATYQGSDLVIGFLDAQNNTNAGVLCTHLLSVEHFDAAFLVGTALGHPERTQLGSVIVARQVLDLSETREGSGSSPVRVQANRSATEALVRDARSFLSDKKRRDLDQVCYQMFEDLSLGSEDDARRFADATSLTVGDEDIASGNEYVMRTAEQTTDELAPLWTEVPTARAYDMESAGFSRAAELAGIPWMVVRGVSDYGTPETRSELNRSVAAGLAGGCLAEFIKLRVLAGGRRSALDFVRRRPSPPRLPSRVVSASSSIFELDDSGAVPFDELIEGATSIRVLGRTAVNVLGNYRRSWVRLLQGGCDVQIAMVHPTSEVARYLYGRNEALYRDNFRQAVRHARDVIEEAAVDPESCGFYLFEDYPPFSTLEIVSSEQSVLRVQLNFLLTRTGRDRPIVELRGGDRWYGPFIEEIDAIFRASRRVSLDTLDLLVRGESA